MLTLERYIISLKRLTINTTSRSMWTRRRRTKITSYIDSGLLIVMVAARVVVVVVVVVLVVTMVVVVVVVASSW